MERGQGKTMNFTFFSISIYKFDFAYSFFFGTNYLHDNQCKTLANLHDMDPLNLLNVERATNSNQMGCIKDEEGKHW